MTDKIIDTIIKALFSKASLLGHIVFCAAQFILHVDQNLVTNIISWEAIFIGIMIGIQQFEHHKVIKKQLTKGK